MRRPATLLALGLAAITAGPAGAHTAIGDAWSGWMTRNARSVGGLVVLQGDRVVLEKSQGAVGTTVRLASLSKAVTAVCVTGLIEKGQLSFETPLSRAMPRTIGRVGAPVDGRLGQVTIGQLLVHRAGFDRRKDEDAALAPTLVSLRTVTARRTAFDDVVKMVFRHKLPDAPGERYAYSNAPYLLLGAMIEEAAGSDYESYCRRQVTEPLGARSAGLDPDWRILSSYGGWRMALADYGRFYRAFAPGNAAIGPVARRWMMAPDGKSVGDGAHYGLGTFVRPLASGTANFWHHGRLRVTLPNAHDGSLDVSYSTYAARYGSLDVTVVSYSETAATEAEQADLDRVLSAAAHAATRSR